MKKLGTTAAAAIAIATGIIGVQEGVKTKPYRDIGGVMTVCYGETKVEMREHTLEECDAMLAKRVPDYYHSAIKHVKVDIPITMRAAVTSFNYNVGEGNFKSSTMLKKINAGDLWGACSELDRWAYVGQMWVQGLANRRADEKRLCVAELPRRGNV
jgi:lysozyme